MNEFKRLISIKQSLMNDGGRVDIKANSLECAKLAERFDCAHIDFLHLVGHIIHHEYIKGAYIFNGIITGIYKENQTDPMVTVDDNFTVSLLWREPDTPHDDMDYELIMDGSIDFGELAAQYFYLMIDTFVEDAVISVDALSISGQKSVHPFLALRDLVDSESEK